MTKPNRLVVSKVSADFFLAPANMALATESVGGRTYAVVRATADTPSPVPEGWKNPEKNQVFTAIALPDKPSLVEVSMRRAQRYLKARAKPAPGAPRRWRKIEGVQLRDPGQTVMPISSGTEHLMQVRLVGQHSLELTFADGLTNNLAISRLGMPVKRMRWDTAKASPTGHAMTVTGIKGDEIRVAATRLRYLIDADYAAKVKAELAALEYVLDDSADEGQPPAGLFDRPEPDAVLASWK